MATRQVLGRVLIVMKGEYNNTEEYEKLDVVTYDGSSYIAKKDTVGNLPTNTEFWDLLAKKGDDNAISDEDLEKVKNEVTEAIKPDVQEGIKEDLDKLINISPLVASSIDEMTDTTRVYVNTTDGNWYYYDGANWEIGGIYQATKIQDNSVNQKMLNFIKKGINQYVVNNITDNGCNFYQDENGFTHIVGTAKSSKRTIITSFTLDKQTNLRYRASNGTRPSTYIYNQLDKQTIVQTIGMGSTNQEFTLEAGTYDIEVYLISGTEYNSNYFASLIDTNYELLIRDNIYKASNTPISNNFLNIDDTPILNIKTINAICNIKDKKPFIFNMIDKTFTINRDIYLLYYDTYQPNLPFNHLYFFNLASHVDSDKTYDLCLESGLNAIFFNIKTLEVKILNYTDWNNTDKIDKYDYTLCVYFYSPSSNEFRNYLILNNNTEVISPLKTNLTGKKLSICGVSVDTFTGYIPEGNVSYYGLSNLPSVDVTWWKRLINNTGLELLVNNSWSGACATTTKNLTSSGVQRCTELGTNPDFIIIGAFALNDWASSNLTDYDKSTMSIPDIDVDLTITENYEQYKDTIESYGGAIATMFYRIMQKYPNAKIFAMDAYNYYRNGYYPFTPNVNSPKINMCNDILYNVAKQFGIEVIKLSQCGITAFNSRTYCVEGTESTLALHPNPDGMTMLYNETIGHFKKFM